MNKEKFLSKYQNLGDNGELLTLWAINTIKIEKEPIILVKSVKKRIAEKTGLELSSISVYICKLNKKGILKQISRATYEMPLIAT